MPGNDVPRTGWRWWLWPLRSRKVQVAIATAVAAWLAEWGVDAPAGVIAAVIAGGVSIVLGIAIEDAGRKAAGG